MDFATTLTNVPQKKKYYAGIGPRKVPDPIKSIITNVSRTLCKDGWILRSGHAEGCDKAFEDGVIHPDQKQIFLPWEGFNGAYSDGMSYGVLPVSKNQYDTAKRHHPFWEKCSKGAISLLCRNVPILLGEDLQEPVELVITWHEPNHIGGTGYALSIAQEWGIPVYNIYYQNEQHALVQFLMARENMQ